MSVPLAYVFWHWPRSIVGQKAYDTKLFAFQDSLRTHGAEGLIDALSFRVRGLPWAKPRSVTREDWYVVRDFGSLGALNDSAVAGANRKPHDDVANDASGSAGGVYKLRQGDLPLRSARFATWIRKPAGTPYQEFLDDIATLVMSRRTDLWQRQMVLGPAPEFCLHSESRLDIPRKLRPTSVRVQLSSASGNKGLGGS